MTYSITDRWGAMQRDAPVARLREVLQSLDIADDEHASVALTHETEWCLSVFPSGLLVWENLEIDENNARHMKGVSREKVLALWLKLAEGVGLLAEYQSKLAALGLSVWAQACPMFVHLVEEGLAGSSDADVLAHHYLAAMPQIDTLILGCTHYPVLAPVIQRVAGEGVTLVSSADVTAEVVSRSRA